MELLQIIVLALIQGITEFLPISSSAHLILVPPLTGWRDQGLAFDVAVHFGSLLAVVSYFQRDLRQMLAALAAVPQQRRLNAEARLALIVAAATLPAVVAGVVFKENIETVLRSPQVIALATIVFGLLLWLADAIGRRYYPNDRRSEYQIGWRDGLLIGLAQAIALIPGTSRSGITMTAALALGYQRQAAARFSFLLSIPVIAGATLLLLLDLVASERPVPWGELGLSSLLAAISAYACIHLFLKVVERVGFLPFILYRLALGVFLLMLF